MNLINQQEDSGELSRARLVFVVILVIFSVFSVRLFYLQVINHEKYVRAARSDQIREYEVDADRGRIYAQMGGKTVPLVLNQKLYTVYADPSMIKDKNKAANALAPLLGASKSDIRELLDLKDRRYVVLKKRADADVNRGVLGLKLPGIGSQERNYRIYPHGSLAAQLLGFVDDDGEGKYGVEQSLDRQLAGNKGQLRAVTDVHGIPLAANTDNLVTEPVAGEDIELTIDLGMQTQLEKILKNAQEKFNSKKVSAVILETNTGAVKAMANYPTYDPSNYQAVKDGTVFQNAVVAEPIEPGSITKIFSAAAGIDAGAITATSSYDDPGVWTIDGAKVVNVAEGKGSGRKDIKTVLNDSLNTGAVWILMQMGGGKINEKARQTMYDYYTKKYRLDQPTGIEQGYEGIGLIVPPENKDNGINITYANMSFGQAYSATAIQMGAAMNAVINGGTYYRPHLVATRTNTETGRRTTMQPEVVAKNVVSKKTSEDIVGLLNYAVKAHESGWSYMKFPGQYMVGGKTGTAEMVHENGRGYRTDLYNGTYMGYVGGDKPQYTIVVYNYEPRNYSGYAGASTGQPLFAEIAHMLINNFGVTPK